ncbi:MAG TPA: Nramp family divalent metal transporter [Gaiellaceae bacterium]|nr:Nramp family divalent metal transporter [Gaiellaceae bacterium]
MHPYGQPLPEGLRTVDEALHRTRFRILPFLGPAFIAAVAYIDPGNFATNIGAGSRFGYRLVWVVIVANALAMLIQTLSAKLGLATRKSLPELCRDHLPRRVVLAMWMQAEVVAMATDLAEFLGAAVGIDLLTGIGLFPAALLAGVAAFAILELQRFGIRLLEAVIAALVGVIGACYVIELSFAHPDWHQVLRHAVTPRFGGSGAVLLSVGILGATVMPHVIYLHSALTQDRLVAVTPQQGRTLQRYTRFDVVIAMSIAGVINVAMLVMAASTFFRSGLHGVESLESAHRTLQPILGSGSTILFALALAASGLSSSAVGTLSGQVVMQGFVRRQIPVAVRRLATMVPAFVVIALGLDPTRTLVVSQVVLSFGIPFALVPLVVFTARRDVMGAFVNTRLTTAVAAAVAAAVVALNVFLLATIL